MARIDLTNVKMSKNPFDEIAVEEAIRLEKAGVASEVKIEDSKSVVTREVDGGLQIITVTWSAIVTSEQSNASLPNIMKAKNKPLDEKAAVDYGVDTASRPTVVATEEPADCEAGIMVGSVDELVEKLKEGGLV